MRELFEIDVEVFADADADASLEVIADSEGDGERVCTLDALLDSVTLAVFETRDDGLRLILVDELAVGDELEDDC